MIETLSFRMPNKAYEDWKKQPRDLVGWTVQTDFLGHPVKGIVTECRPYTDEHLGPGVWLSLQVLP